MPLTEFLRMSKGKLDAKQIKASTSDVPAFSKVSRGPSSNTFPILTPKQAQEDSRMASSSKMAKLSSMDPGLTEFPLSVPSCEMGFDQDVDMLPWLNYPVHDPLHNDYASDFLRELSGVTVSELPTEQPLGSKEKRGGFLNNGQSSTVVNVASLKRGNSSKAPSSAEKHTRSESREVPRFLLPFQHNASKSGISGITGNNTCNIPHVTSQDSMGNPSSLCGFPSLRLQKLDAGQPSSSSGFTNFSYFSRPAAIARANHVTANDSKRLESDDKKCSLSSGTHANSLEVKESLPLKPTEESHSSNQAACKRDVTMKDASQDQAHGTSITNARIAGEKNKEPVFATSSVCSGNSAERTSNEHAHDLKRKARETMESDGPSDDADEESVGVRKAAPPRTGAKRSRAAEVHNLSERRRRDRINEKMRALQELIPNCNKADKASMLDEAIEYLKALQLQVQLFCLHSLQIQQMLSMGAGLYMQPMVVPPGMQSIHGAHMPHFSPMGVGMGMGMGLGMNMLDVNSGMKLMPFQGLQYPVIGAGPTLHVMPGSSLQPFAHPGQGLTMAAQRAPVLPVSGIPPLKVPMAANVSGVAGSTSAAMLAPYSNSKDGLQSIPKNSVNGSVNSASNQAKNLGPENPSPSHDKVQVLNKTTGATTTSAAGGTDKMPG
ncbi:hypothetical protein Cgig2_030195 [Carnegiea gigantea]|uniref:BHLH domain-containing protein n=1 Tax=Carnegiea gigantea TaxID=171969 RepID=A0A9Q1QG52_9CARY|nr:hypothetical protein Cgig2_030195 [Carnegiea gigantea]